MHRLSLWFLIFITLILAQSKSPDTQGTSLGTALGSRMDIGPQYFQQGVKYEIQARLDTKSDIISGTEKLIYQNNSPDTLDYVYFHLYQDAFQPGSLHDERQFSEGDYSLRKLQPGQKPGIRIDVLKDGTGYDLDSMRSDTRLKVSLSQPLPPGESCEFAIQFSTRMGNVNRRMHKGSDYYVGSQWYPRMAVYDQHRGWNIDPHLGHEFFGDYGTFEWSLTLPANYIVEGTGFLTNREEMLPHDLMAKLDIRNFKDKPFNSPASVVIPPTDSTKTWSFRAENVHDIAWIASPDFRIGTAHWEDVTVYAMAREQHAAKWQDAVEIGAAFIADYSQRWGRYRYHKMVVSDVDDGMEYPMLTADSGSSPGYIGLLGHEIGHNWFFGMIGSNETYRAFLDEGFTNFITCTTMDSIWGEGSATPYEGWYAKTFYPRKSRKYIRNDWRYLRFTRSGFENFPLNTHSDQFEENANYRLVYSKTTSMLYALEAALGHDVFFRGMRKYFSRYLFQHPYPEDFQKVMEEVSGRRLDWFFEQWLNTTRQIDYAVTGLKNFQSDGKQFAKVTLHRFGEMSLPLDIAMELADGSLQMIHVPNRFDQVKPLSPNWQVTEPWLGWQRIHPDFTFKVPVQTKAKRILIDPSGRLMDINRLNNSSGFPKLHWQFDNLKVYHPTLDAYDIYLRPSVLYNLVDGLKPGLHWSSGYLISPEIRQYHVTAEVHYAGGRSAADFALFFESPVKSLGKLTHFYLKLKDQDGRRLLEGGLTGVFRDRLYLKPMQEAAVSYRESEVTDERYIPKGQTWDTGIIRSLIFHYGRENRNSLVSIALSIDLETAVSGGEFLYTQQNFQTIGHFLAMPSLKIRGVAARQTGNVPAQFGLRPGGARFFDMAEQNWLYRGAGSLGTSDWLYSRLQSGGGGNLRGLGTEIAPLKWLAGINLEYELRSGLFLWQPLVRSISKLGLRFYLFGSYVGFELQSDISDGRSLTEGGAGIYLPFHQIPTSLGKYGIRIDHAYPISGEGLSERTVFALERAW